MSSSSSPPSQKPLSSRLTQLQSLLQNPTTLSLLLRLFLLHATPATELLERRAELVTPMTGMRNLREGVFLHSKGQNPYIGGTFHHSPLYLSLCSSLIPSTSPILTSLLWILADYISSQSLRHIYESRPKPQTKSNKPTSPGSVSNLHSNPNNWGQSIQLLYLLNPYTLLSALALSTTNLNNCLILLAIRYACQSNEVSVEVETEADDTNSSPDVSVGMSMFFLALATHTTLYPVLLLPLLILLIREQQGAEKGKGSWIMIAGKAIGLFGMYFAILGGFSYVAAGSEGWEWVSRTWGMILTLTDLSPNPGLWYYFFTEMFDHFKVFFLGVWQLHLISYVVPLAIRFEKQPLFAVMIMCGVISTFKSYPTLADSSVWLGLLGCFPEIWSELRHPLLSTCIHLYATILMPLLHNLWLVQGTANANFFYAIGLVWGLAEGMAIVDVLGAGMRVEVNKKVLERLRVMQEEDEEGVKVLLGLEEVGVVLDEKTTMEDLGLVVVQYTTLDD